MLNLQDAHLTEEATEAQRGHGSPVITGRVAKMESKPVTWLWIHAFVVGVRGWFHLCPSSSLGADLSLILLLGTSYYHHLLCDPWPMLTL